MGESAPGWYPDPSGDGQERYFDGAGWTSARRARRQRSKWALWGTIGGVFLLAGGCVAVVAVFGGGGSGGFSDAEIADGVVNTCQEDVRSSLRDPDSAQFAEWKVWEVKSSTLSHGDGDRLYSAAGLVNAKNGFGGYVGATPYSCDAVVSEDGKVRAQTRDVSEALESP